MDQSTICLVEFMAVEPSAPETTTQKLDSFLSKMKGVTQYSIGPGGRVKLSYDCTITSDELIEEVLRRHGFDIQHVSDEVGVDETHRRNVIDGKESTGLDHAA